jgi:hypothetical protein
VNVINSIPRRWNKKAGHRTGLQSNGGGGIKAKVAEHRGVRKRQKQIKKVETNTNIMQGICIKA